ncbi:Ger(x)C family spore germination protein [Clostridium estertheticum]|uniref:Ger(x)C family spore germination protein n=1 Tax=Clostridium estertheticum TaxID=238834 RepID=UPI001C0ABCAA|nr:Ger(x)C family spore germination protein [Clostridium estertheticum]MBU3177440.1 Ger(x)C family spore germination protein [Clostridium estertheticum]
MKKKIVIIISIIIICPIMFCGCWNYSEIDKLGIVAGMAIDKDVLSGKYILTIELITSESQGASSTTSSKTYTSEGYSIFNAERTMVSKVGLALFWSQAKVVIISDSVANSGVLPILDWVNRDSDLRPDMWLLIAKGNSASEILKATSSPNEIASFNLDDTMNLQKLLSKFPASRVWSFVDRLSSEGHSQTVATVKAELDDDIITSHVDGCAIFKSDKLVGYLDGTETLYMLMIKNKIQEGLIPLKKVSGSDTNVTLEIFENKTKLTPLYKNGKASLTIDINPVVIIAEVEGSKDFMNEENLKTLQSETEKQIENNIQSLISKIQKNYDNDVLGLGDIFEKESPKVHDDFKNKGENIFAKVKTKVNVHLQIKGSGKTKRPIPIKTN